MFVDNLVNFSWRFSCLDQELRKLSNNICSDTFGCFSDVRDAQGLEELESSVLLKLFVGITETYFQSIITCDDLDDSVPNVIFDFGVLNKFDHNVNVPNQVFSKHLGQNCDFKHQIISHQWVVSGLKVPQQLGYDFADVLMVANQVEQIEGSTSD